MQRGQIKVTGVSNERQQLKDNGTNIERLQDHCQKGRKILVTINQTVVTFFPQEP
jgi:hypothetical protein